jgi:uncharacterized protein YpmS
MELLSRTWGAIAVPLTILLTTIWNRRHQNEIEDTESQSKAMTAITDANTQLTKLMSLALEPIQEQLIAQRAQLEQHKREAEIKMDYLQSEIDVQRRQLHGFYDWVISLRRQIISNGMEPVQPPLDLDLDGFMFD